MAQAEMWRSYLFQGVRVRVIQKWTDPFGQPMVRIEATAEDDDRATGIPERAFLDEAEVDDTAPSGAENEPSP